MAWIESHQELRDHPKLLELCDLLGAERPPVVGHLHFLWWWCIDYAANGDVTKYSPRQIARAAWWSGDAIKFYDALVSSGFIERIENTAKIHDWQHYCGALMERRLQRLAAKRPPLAAERPPTVPDLTIPNHNYSSAIAAVPRDAFNLIWAKYPRKIGKESAAEKFKSQVRQFTDWLDIQKALDGYVAYIAKEKIEEKYIQHGSTWFNKKWRNWINYAEEINAPNGRTSFSEYAAIAKSNREAAERRKKELASGPVSSGV